jgi:RimJ/RimL family protein N-acetyltransferase
MTFELQPRLENDLVRLEPVTPGDFEALYAVAADELLWAQHPNKNRYQREVFAVYFQGALESGGASCVFDNVNGELIGCSRYYELDEPRAVSIGYTFIARRTWGLGYNRALKTLMLDHAFRFVERVVFHVGAQNFRSRRAMEKLGGQLVGEASVAYHGEPSSPNVIYEIKRSDWASRR